MFVRFSSKWDFTLTDNTGNKYKLMGDNNDLRMLIGNEVQVTGQMAGAPAGANSGTTGSTATSSPGDQTGAAATTNGATSSANTGTPGAPSGQNFEVTSATKVATIVEKPTTLPGLHQRI